MAFRLRTRYRDPGFPARALWYHLGFALRNRGKRRVHTVALWLTSPPRDQPRDTLTVDDITVKVTTVVLHEVKASTLLADPCTACFAAGADREGRSDAELCAEVAAALRVRRASWAERHLAVVAAAMRGRYEWMVMAMENADMEPVVIEDLVRFGEDRGRKKGLVQGRRQGRELGRKLGFRDGKLEGLRDALLRLTARAGITLREEERARIQACNDAAILDRWVENVLGASTAADVLS